MPLGKVRFAAISFIDISLDPRCDRLSPNLGRSSGKHNSTIRCNRHRSWYICKFSVVDDKGPGQRSVRGSRELDKNRCVGDCSVNDSLCTSTLRPARLDSRYTFEKGCYLSFVSRTTCHLKSNLSERYQYYYFLCFTIIIYLTVVELDILVCPT